MKKKTVVIVGIIVAVLVALLVGGYVLVDYMLFPKAKPIKQLAVDVIESVRLTDNADNEIAISDTELQTLLTYINGAEATRIMSVNDYPSVRPYYVLELKTAERVYRYMIYEERGTVYAEIPYEGIYKISREAIEMIK